MCLKSPRAPELSAANYRPIVIYQAKQPFEKYLFNDVRVFFTGEKIITVATAKNPLNLQLYAPDGATKKNQTPAHTIDF